MWKGKVGGNDSKMRMIWKKWPLECSSRQRNKKYQIKSSLMSLIPYHMQSKRYLSESNNISCVKSQRSSKGVNWEFLKKLTKSPRGVTLNISLNRLERKQGYGKQIHADLYLFPSVSCSIDIFLLNQQP